MVDFAATPNPDILEVFDNPYPDREYLIKHVCPEFTSLCPKTGQPDYGELTFEYIADEKCVELKSLKLYLQAYRNYGAFYERVTNQILDDLVNVVEPRYMKLTAKFTPRGGMHSEIEVEYFDEQYGADEDADEERCSCGCSRGCCGEDK